MQKDDNNIVAEAGGCCYVLLRVSDKEVTSTTRTLLLKGRPREPD